MNNKDRIEQERYELYEKSRYHFELDRRQFLKVFGGGVVLIVPLSRLHAQQQEESGRGEFSREFPQEIGAWIHIDEDGSIQVFTGKTEMGQNIRTSLAQAVAEELHVPVSMIRLIMADTELTPFDMGTFGSLSTPRMAPQLRKAAAAAREVLIDLAAQQWNVNRGGVRIENARFVNHHDGSSLSFADLTKGQKIAKMIPEEIATTPAAEWTIAGTSVPKVDGRDFVTGKHKYTSDIKRPSMLFGVVVRPPGFESTIVSADIAAAQAMPGVIAVRDENFIGVAAPDPETASQAAKRIKVEWKTPPQPSNAELFDLLKKPAPPDSRERGRQSRRREPVIQGRAAAILSVLRATAPSRSTTRRFGRNRMRARRRFAKVARTIFL